MDKIYYICFLVQNPAIKTLIIDFGLRLEETPVFLLDIKKAIQNV